MHPGSHESHSLSVFKSLFQWKTITEICSTSLFKIMSFLSPRALNSAYSILFIFHHNTYHFLAYNTLLVYCLFFFNLSQLQCKFYEFCSLLNLLCATPTPCPAKCLAHNKYLLKEWMKTPCYVATWVGGEFMRQWIMYLCSWIPFLSTWNYHNIVNWLYSNIK